MANRERLDQFEDPLFAGIHKKSEKASADAAEGTRPEPSSRIHLWALLCLAVALSVTAYYVSEAQEKIGWMESSLTASRTQLSSVTEDLAGSQEKIQLLTRNLDQSQARIQVQGAELARYKGLYENLKESQETQQRAVSTLAARKADHEDVAALRDETANIREQVQTTSAQVGELEGTTAQNRRQIEQTRSEVGSLEKRVTANTNEIDGVKRSLEREYYNFELQKGGGYMKVFDVALSLKDTNFERRHFDLYIASNGKAVTKKDQNLNEPILFYIDGVKKPYEIVVTRIDRKHVVGYLSVPVDR